MNCTPQVSQHALSIDGEGMHREDKQVDESDKVNCGSHGHIKRSCIVHGVRDGLRDEPWRVDKKSG